MHKDKNIFTDTGYGKYGPESYLTLRIEKHPYYKSRLRRARKKWPRLVQRLQLEEYDPGQLGFAMHDVISPNRRVRRYGKRMRIAKKWRGVGHNRSLVLWKKKSDQEAEDDVPFEDDEVEYRPDPVFHPGVNLGQPHVPKPLPALVAPGTIVDLVIAGDVAMVNNETAPEIIEIPDEDIDEAISI